MNWIWRKGIKNRVIASMMSVLLVFSSVNVTAYAADDDTEGGNIVGFESLTEDVLFQTIRAGESIEDVVFPTQLQATVEVVTEAAVIPIEEIVAEETTGEAAEEAAEGLTKEPEAEEVIGEVAEEATEGLTKEPEAEEVIGEVAEEAAEELTKEPEAEEVIGEVAEEATEELTKEPEAEGFSEEAVEGAAEEFQAEEITDEAAVEVVDDFTEKSIEDPASAEPEEGTAAKIMNSQLPAMEVQAAEATDEASAEFDEAAVVTDSQVEYKTVILRNLTWEISAEESTAPEFSAEEGDARFVFVPVIPGIYEVNTELPKITVVVEAYEFEENIFVNGVNVKVQADAGVFPDGVTLQVRPVSQAEAALVEYAVDRERNENRNVAASYTFDITVYDKEGNEIEPDTSKGRVKVSFSLAAVANNNLDADVYHITEDEADNLTAEKLDSELEGSNTIAAETDSFSFYTVEFTYGSLQYVLRGGESVALSEIISTVGLSGGVVNATSSNSELFEVKVVDGDWIAQAKQAFTTNETLTVTLNDFVTYLIDVTDSVGSVTVGNHNYPYGKNMSSGITFIVDVELTDAVTYQWYVSSDSGATYSEIAGKSGNLSGTEASFETVFSGGELASERWYKCRFNGDVNSETEAVMVYSANGRYYISNGQMAYSILSGTTFDIIGKYKGSWIRQTSYDYYWNWWTKSEADPAPIGVGGTSPTSNASLLSNKVWFERNDYNGSENNTSEGGAHAMYFASTLGADQRAFSFGCDVMIRSNDAAPATAITNSSGRLQQIQLVDADSLEEATGESAAIVINTKQSLPDKYYVGYWRNRIFFGFGTASDSNNTSYASYYTYDSYGHVTQVTNTDSGITVSWTNLEPGSTITYGFNLGTVAQTGAVTGAVNYEEETIEDLDPNTPYDITIHHEDGSDEVITVTTDENGKLPFEGDDDNDDPYSLLGEDITINKHGSTDNPMDVEIADRPEAQDAETGGTDDQTDATKPSEVGSDTIVTTETTISLNIDPDDATRLSQDYRIYDEDDQEISGKGWVHPGTDGTVVFSGLTPDTVYIIKSRIPATSSTPASTVSAGVQARTIGTINVTIPSERTFVYDGNPHAVAAIATPDDATITYTTDMNEAYGATVPSFINAGEYTVYYKATKDGCRTTYGSYVVTVNKQPVEGEFIVQEEAVPTEVTEGMIIDLSDYLVDGATLKESVVTGDLNGKVAVDTLNGNNLVYDVAGESQEDTTGTLTLTIASTNFRDYQITIPLRSGPNVITAAINYEDEKIEDLKPNTEYEIEIDNGDGTTDTITVTSDENGKIDLVGTDDDGEDYDLIGKQIEVNRPGHRSEPYVADVEGRQNAVNVNTDGTDDDNTYVSKPSELGKDVIVTTDNSVTLYVDPENEERMVQKYRIYDEYGNEIPGQSWVAPDENGVVKFTDLEPSKNYIIRSFKPATSNAPASIPSSGIRVKTVNTVEVSGNPESSYTYDGQPHSFPVTAKPNDATVLYSLSPDAEYSAKVPEFTDAGEYTIYYMITKPGYRPTYGSYVVTINKAPVENVEIKEELEISIEPENGLTLNLADYLVDGAEFIGSSIADDLSKNLTFGGVVENHLVYNIIDDSIAGETGTLTLNIRSSNYGDYQIIIPLKAVKKSTDVVFDASEMPKNAGTSAVKCDNLSEFTEQQDEDIVQVVLAVKPEDEKVVDNRIVEAFKAICGSYYKGVDSVKLFREYLDVKVTKSVNGEAAVAVADVQRVLEIAVSFDLTGKYNPIVIRDHEGTVVRFKKLTEKPVSGFEDGTFYTDGKGIIYIYSRYFSTYSISYTTDPDFVAETEKGSTSYVQAEAELPKNTEMISPKTGEKNDYLLVMLIEAVVIGAFTLILSKRKKKEI